jgi:hypothetical protein
MLRADEERLMRATAMVVMMISLLALGGCGRRNRGDDGPGGRGEDGGRVSLRDRGEERRDDRRDERVEDVTGWEKLGERVVNGAADRDELLVTAREGSFRRLMVKVEHSALEMYDIEVTFGDGETFRPEVRHRFGEDSRTRIIDLPGQARIVRKVVFRYGNVLGGGRAQVELWGK